MSKIDSILTTSNFEIIRSKIASILADELANQKVLNQAALTTEQAKPTPDEDLIDFYNLNINSIPGKVWEERFIRFQPKEMPTINVILINVPLNEGTSHESQITDNLYRIEIYQKAKSTEDNDGDILATLKLHRLLAIIRSILMNREYVNLDLGTKVRRRQTQDIAIGVPNTGAENAQNMIYGKIDLIVKSFEQVNDLDGVPLELHATTMKINDSDLGYYWEIAA